MVQTLPGSVGNVRAASTADGGTALTSTATTILLPFGTRQMNLIPRNYSGATVVKWTKVPWLTVVKTTDLLVSTLTDYSNAAQDGDASTDVVLSSLDTLANGDALYVGAAEPFIGLTCDMDAGNDTASVLSVDYWDGSAFSDITPTDGTDVAGDTFKQDGNITWTEPSDWVARELNEIVSGVGPSFGSIVRRQLFWVRLTVSAALDSSTTLNSMTAIPRANYQELPVGKDWSEGVQVGLNGFAGLYALTNAGTANLVVDVAAKGVY